MAILVRLAQLAPAHLNVRKNVDQICTTVKRRAAAGLIVFPEMFLSGYPAGRGFADVAVDFDGPELRAIGNAARSAGSAVILGTALRLPSGLGNAVVCIESDGTITGCRLKSHPWDIEQDFFVTGDTLECIGIAGVRAGIMICFEMEFPEVARTLALQGAQVLITISANMKPFGPDHDLAVRARALENGLPHIYVNRVGAEDGNTFVGESKAVDCNGNVLAEAEAQSTVLDVEVELPGLGNQPRIEYLRQRRPELYLTHAAPAETDAFVTGEGQA